MQSAAAQVIIAIVPIVGIFIGGIVVFFYLLWRHHEIKLQIKTGTYITPQRNFKALALFCGLTLTSVGLILTLVFGILNRLSYSVLGGLLPFVTGVSSLLFYKLNPEFHTDKPNTDQIPNRSLPHETTTPRAHDGIDGNDGIIIARVDTTSMDNRQAPSE